MNIRPPLTALAVVAVLIAAVPSANAAAEWGGIVKENRDARLRLTAGVLFDFEGMVAETERKFYTVTGIPLDQQGAESYDLSDFELDDMFGMVGLSYDVAWHWFRLQIDTAFLNPSTDHSTARRDYYLSVNDDIPYNGSTYDHLMIADGDVFSAELFGNMTEFTMMFVPVGFQAGDWLTLNPSLDLGILLFGGQYEIDDGPARGLTQYQYPPEDFVIGGHAKGFLGIGVPQWGAGVDLQLGRDGELNFSVQAHYLFSSYDGSTALFTTADHREKNLDFDHRNIRIRGELEIPIKNKTILAGIQVQMIDTDGMLESTSTDPEEIIAMGERFDKEFNFKLHSVLASIGMAF